MHWKKLILPPIAIYAVIFLFVTVLIGAHISTEVIWVTIVNFVIMIIGLYLAISYAKPKNLKEGLIYGLIWLAVFFLLDIILTVPFTGWNYFFGWKTWVAYGLTLLMPTLWPKK